MNFSSAPSQALPIHNAIIKENLVSSFAETSYGLVLASVSEIGVRSVILGDNANELQAQLRLRYPAANHLADSSDSRAAAMAVAGLVENPAAGFAMPLDIRGTEFQKKVWQALIEIPPGTTTTYAAVASSIGNPTAVRAVGAACGANTLAVIVPCHRVLSSTGKLTGYRWGLSWKQLLLEREGACLKHSAFPN